MATIRADELPQPAPKGPAIRVPTLVALMAVAAALVWSYLPSFSFLLNAWDHDPNYSYGFFVIPLALLILWTRRHRLDPAKLNAPWWGLLLPVAVLALRYPLFEWNELFVETATIPLLVATLVFAVGGLHLLRVCWPSLLFLLFMYPLPPSINQILASPLQRLATLGSLSLLQLMGLPVMAEGNVIVVGSEQLEVARACNGLSMLLSFVTLITAVVLLIDRPWLDRVLLFLSAIPIALISNIIRITATAMVYHFIGHETGEKLAHDFAGWMMMPVALLLVWVELKVWSWMFVEVEEIDPSTLLRRSKKK
ncbi:MAG: exosortase/archaeosortase family protein [Isosphaeraceae bacterium]